MKKTLLALSILLSAVSYADNYTMDPGTSSIEWKAGKKVGSFHNGKIQLKSGELQTDAKGMITAAQVSVAMNTITNEDLKDSPDYQKKLVSHLSSEDFFNVEKFPEATFKLKGMKKKPGSKGEFIATGDLTMIGTTKPIEFPVKVTSEKDQMKFSATLKIERLNWGLQYGSGSIFKTLTADKIINDTFDLTLNLTAKRGS
jgi:polyisoprenoid-binding protein YceI